MRCALPLVGIVLALTAARPSLTPTHASPGPGPGAPFGGDDTGCVPATAATLKCAGKAAKTVAALIAAVAKCHGRPADARFAGSAYDEEGCETAARARFDGVLASLAASGSCAGSTTLSAAEGLASTLLADAGNPDSLRATEDAGQWRRHGAERRPHLSQHVREPVGDARRGRRYDRAAPRLAGP